MEIKKYPELNKVYKHYKGGTYRVLTLAKHTENNEVLIICQSLEFGSIHARPLELWFEVVEKQNGPFNEVKRFTLIE